MMDDTPQFVPVTIFWPTFDLMLHKIYIQSIFSKNVVIAQEKFQRVTKVKREKKCQDCFLNRSQGEDLAPQICSWLFMAELYLLVSR